MAPPEQIDPATAPPRVSVVIPVLNAAGYLPRLLDALMAQQPEPPREIILVDSMSTDATREIASGYPRVRVIPIEDFTHGRSRNLGGQAADGDIVAVLTQDALPADQHWLSALVQAFDDPRVGGAYSRQTPYPGADPVESYYLHTHFPPGPGFTRSKAGDDRELAHRDIFFSSVSSAVRRGLLLAHPYDESLIMSEDHQLARDLLDAGHAIVYVPESCVVHSHAYTLLQVLRRYFDSMYAIRQILPGHGVGDSVSSGTPYIFDEFKHILIHHPGYLPRYIGYTAAKVTGVVLGHAAPMLPRWLKRKVSMHAYHWK